MNRTVKSWQHSLLLVLIMFLSACHEDVLLEPIQEEQSEIPVRVIARYADSVTESRLNYVDDDNPNQPMQVTWGSNDKIKVFVELSPKAGTETRTATLDYQWDASYMAIKSGAGTNQAEFAGYFRGTGAHEIADGAKVWAFYPITAELSTHKLGMEINLHRMITSYGKINELMYYDYMVAEGLYTKDADGEGGTVDLQFHHQVSMLRLELTIPKTDRVMPINEIKLESNDLLTRGSLTFDKTQLYAPTCNAEDERKKQYVEFKTQNKPVTSITGPTKITAYMAVMPVQLDEPLNISAEVGGDVYSTSITLNSKPTLEAGLRYALQAELNGALIADYSWYLKPESDGTYLLKDEADLRGFSNITNGSYLPSGIAQDSFKDKVVKMNNDVTLTADWLPIASSNQFAGTFDGQGHIINNLQIDKEHLTAQGFFSTLSGGGVVRNLTIGSGRVVCYDSGGGIVGLLMQSRVVNCTNKADISIISEAAVFDELTQERQDPSVGGIVGFSLQGVVMGCVNYGKVKSVAYASSGGIVGFNYPFNFKDETIGATDSGGYVIACANHGTIIGGSISAGIIGYNKSYSHGAIGCYNSYNGSEHGISDKLSEGNGCFVIADTKDGFKDKDYLTATTQSELNNTGYVTMNEAVVTHNKKFGLNSMFYCPYQWKTGADGWPIIEEMGSIGGSTGDYGNGGQLGN